MKKLVTVQLIIILVLSIALNVVLLFRLYGNNHDNEMESLEISSNVSETLAGTWEGSDKKLEIFSDGTAYLSFFSDEKYGPSGQLRHTTDISTRYIGYIDGYSIVLSQSYNWSNDYSSHESMSEISAEALNDVYFIYDITMHGSSAITMQNASNADTIYPFIKQEATS